VRLRGDSLYRRSARDVRLSPKWKGAGDPKKQVIKEEIEEEKKKGMDKR